MVVADIRDAAAVRRAVTGVDVVYHNVAQVPLAATGPLCDPSTSTARQRCCTRAGTPDVGKVVHTSSSAVFGIPESNPVRRDTVPNPVEPYGAAKLAAEWACLRAAADGLDVTIVRPRTIVGHGRLGIFGILFDWIADGADPFVLGDGSNRYQFVHADDLAALCVAPRRRSGPAIFNAGTDRFGTMREAIEHVCAHAGTGAQVRSLPRAAAAAAMRATARPRADAVRPVPLADVRAVDVVRHRPRPRRARLAAALLERRDARRELRLVRRQPQPAARRGHPHRPIAARPSSRLLSLLKRISA